MDDFGRIGIPIIVVGVGTDNSQTKTSSPSTHKKQVTLMQVVLRGLSIAGLSSTPFCKHPSSK